MEVQAKAPRKGCISDGCRVLTIKTDDPAQQKFLTALHDCFVRGGKIVVTPKGKPASTLEAAGFMYFDEPTKPTGKNERDHTTTGP